MGTGPFQDEPLNVIAPPWSSTATQKLVVGHDTEVRSASSIWLGDEKVDPLKVNSFPTLSTATHKELVAHETDSSAFGESTLIGADQSVSVVSVGYETLPE
jgi:hypothetical protein